ncbi:MAG: NAD-dependent epimerase/dehydratase family protein [Candidatus Hodarchaeota archaeon]
MKILVTGSSGFIGNYVIEELLKLKKYKIIATDIKHEILSDSRSIKEIHFISCDLNQPRENFFTFFEEPDLLIHLAWEGLPNYEKLFHFEKNLPKNYFFLKNMITNGLKNLSVIGTCFEYGLKEGCLSEEIETNPIIPYPIAKDVLRRYIEQLNKEYDFNFKWIRLFYLYGKGQNPKSLLSQLDIALDNNEKIFNMSGGEQLRDYLPVEKVAEYIVKISLQNKINGIINCCSGKPISVRSLVEKHLKEKNKTIHLNLGYYPYPDYVPMAFWGDNTKLKKILREYK